MQASRNSHSRQSHDPIQVTLSLKTHLPHPWLGIFRIFPCAHEVPLNLCISGTHVCEFGFILNLIRFLMLAVFEIMNVCGMVIDTFAGAYIGPGVGIYHRSTVVAREAHIFYTHRIS